MRLVGDRPEFDAIAFADWTQAVRAMKKNIAPIVAGVMNPKFLTSSKNFTTPRSFMFTLVFLCCRRCRFEPP
jgi:hypothetical protein